VSARTQHVGRFAPSPTGPLHLGSVVSAIGSWLEARRAGGRWLLRFDDLDRARNAAGAEAAIRRELVRLGLEWDGPHTRQSADPHRYAEAIASLRGAALAFPCACTRSALVRGVYPGICRDGMPPGGTERSLRLRVDDRRTVLDDAVQGRFEQRLRSQVGDFVIRRADGIVAYHLATVVDDARAGVTHVIRGADLLDSTPRQIALQRALGLATPRYAHLPMVVDAHGRKLSKQSGALDTRTAPAASLWRTALDVLGHPPPAPLRDAPAAQLRDWALATWSLSRVPRTPAQAPVQALACGDPAGVAAAAR